MASYAVEVPADTTQAQRCSQADRTFERRAFVATFIAVSVAICMTFCVVYTSLRTRAKA